VRDFYDREPIPPVSKYSCTITIEGADAKIDGTFPLNTVVDATSYFQLGYRFTARYRCHQWDGRIKLFKKVSRTFPAGLTDDVVKALRKEHVQVMVDDKRHCPASVVLDPKSMTLRGIKFDHPFDYQPECALTVANGQRGIVAVATNGGKCLGLGTSILRFDGTVVPVEKIKIGDLLMGPDSKPRRILSVTRGEGPLFKIIPNKGIPWVCNDVHVLTLKHTVTDKIIDIPLDQ
jgi:hypothetical protein